MTIDEAIKSLQGLISAGVSPNTDVLVHDATGDALVAEDVFVAGGKAWIV